jgi:hypothetical protein
MHPQATWELSSESYVMAKTGREYGRIYRKHPNWPGRIIFRVGMALLSTLLTRWVDFLPEIC